MQRWRLCFAIEDSCCHSGCTSDAKTEKLSTRMRREWWWWKRSIKPCMCPTNALRCSELIPHKLTCNKDKRSLMLHFQVHRAPACELLHTSYNEAWIKVVYTCKRREACTKEMCILRMHQGKLVPCDIVTGKTFFTIHFGMPLYSFHCIGHLACGPETSSRSDLVLFKEHVPPSKKFSAGPFASHLRSVHFVISATSCTAPEDMALFGEATAWFKDAALLELLGLVAVSTLVGLVLAADLVSSVTMCG